MCRPYVVRDNRFGVPRIIAIDMRDSCIEILHDADGQNEIPVLGRRSDVRQDAAGISTSAQFHAVCTEERRHLRQELRCNAFVDEQRFRRIADGGT